MSVSQLLVDWTHHWLTDMTTGYAEDGFLTGIGAKKGGDPYDGLRMASTSFSSPSSSEHKVLLTHHSTHQKKLLTSFVATTDHWETRLMEFLPRDYFSDMERPQSRYYRWPTGPYGGVARYKDMYWNSLGHTNPMGTHPWLEELAFLKEKRMLHPDPEMAPPPCEVYGYNWICGAFERTLAPVETLKQRRMDNYWRLHPQRWDEYDESGFRDDEYGNIE